MTSPTLLKTRRAFLKTTVFVSGTALLVTGLNFTVKPGTRTIAEKLISYLDHPELARKLGRSIFREHAHLNELSLEQMTDLVLQDAGLKRESVTYLSLYDDLEIYRKTVHDDFATENVLRVDGWLLSKTEAHLCTLLTLYEKG